MWSEESVGGYVRSGTGFSYLSDTEVHDEWRVLGVGQWAASCVVATEVGSAVDDDTLNGHAEATVQSNDAVGLDGLLDAVNQAVVLAVSSSFADISTQAGTSVIQRIDEAKRSGSSSTTGSQVSDEVAPELCLLVNAAQEDLFVDILEGEVKGLGREISDDVGQVTTPEGAEALFLWNTDEAIDDACRIKISKSAKSQNWRLNFFQLQFSAKISEQVRFLRRDIRQQVA